MGDWTEIHHPCPHCGSSDAASTNEDGWSTCFSCSERWRSDGGAIAVGDDDRTVRNGLVTWGEIEHLPKRGIDEETCRKYGYTVAVVQGSKAQVAPYHDEDGRVVAQKVRFKDKTFTFLGEPKKARLFGQKLLRPGGKMVVITEGEIDALSVTQVMGLSWPALSLPNGASGARKALAAQLEYLETFEKVVLAFDNDGPGREAVEDCADLFSPGKLHIVDFGDRKDANEFLQAGATKQLRDAVWGARQWRPDGVVCMADMRDRVKRPLTLGVTYPWAGLNGLLYGFRPQELITWTAGTGVGKTAVVSELVYHLLTHGIKTGIIYLEEGIDRAGKRIVGMHMNKPLHLPGQEYTEEEFDEAFDATLGSGLLYAYDHFGSLSEDILLSRIRYMVKALGCKVVVLDHVSMVVSGMDLDADERRTIDHIMTSLRSLTQETGATIHVVSHLRRIEGKKGHEDGVQVALSHLRGSQAIAQLSDAVIGLERNQQADGEERNTTTVRVLKNRYAGTTGPCARLAFSPATGRLTERPLEDTDDFPEEDMNHDDF